MPFLIRLVCTVFIFLLSFSLPAFGSDSLDNSIKIDTPETVGVGQPFLVRLFFPQKVDEIEVFWLGHSVRPTINEEGGASSAVALLGAGLKIEPALHPLEVKAHSNGKTYRLQKQVNVVPHEYQRETLSVEPKLINPPHSELKRIERERELSLNAINSVSPQRLWQVPFSPPVKGKKLSRFGLHRVFNGESKRRHRGLDFRAYLGTPIHPIAPGKVILVGDFYYAGNCVYIDHGNGVISASVHLSKVFVEVGDSVELNQKIGLSGATGRATGAHLHLSVFTQGLSIDPEPLFTMAR